MTYKKQDHKKSRAIDYEFAKLLKEEEEMFNEDGTVKDPERLKEFIKTLMFIEKEKFDYDQITHRFVK